jgi:starch synthase
MWKEQIMHVLFATSEVAPYSKTGGLGDVCGALPKALVRLGCKVSVVTPYYKSVADYFQRTGEPCESLYGVTLSAPVGNKTIRAGVIKATVSGVDFYFIEHNDYFNREGLYNYQGIDYEDNHERFSFFSQAALELVTALDLDVNVVHAHDWQTGLVPVYLDAVYKSRSKFDVSSGFGNSVRPQFDNTADRAQKFDDIKSVITIHNLRHQGRFWRGAMDVTGLDWSYFTYDKMEFFGQLNFLKSGIVFSDMITTVSPKYAQEIQTEEFGERLQGVLQLRSPSLRGILNGIDIDEWNPATDKYIAANYDLDTFEIGKPKCKAALQQELGLNQDPNTPLLGVVSRFDPQKGLDLIADCAAELIEHEGVQFAILGSGDETLGSRFHMLSKRYPQSFALRNEFSIGMSHKIEAGADLFLMPSRYEPCGLNQMYSLRYGTLPLVHDVGGLHDTVVNASDENIANGTGNGFVFYWENVDDMRRALNWALYVYRCRKDDWKSIIRTAMSSDLSWEKSAREYLNLYEEMTAEN